MSAENASERLLECDAVLQGTLGKGQKCMYCLQGGRLVDAEAALRNFEDLLAEALTKSGKELKAKTQADAEHSEVLELKSARDEMRRLVAAVMAAVGGAWGSWPWLGKQC
eukprot:Skav216994  [mRNA]  locus=scaffold594:309768:312826:- [translate_table: standard]